MPAVWNAPTTTDADRKQLIRHLAEQVRITVHGTSEKAGVEVTWAGGHRTSAQITRPVACLTQLSYYPQLAARARELTDSGSTLTQIAQRLNAEGFRPPKRIDVFTPNAASDLLRALGIQRSRPPAHRPALAQHEWWLRDLAAHLGMSQITLDSWVRRGWADGYLHPHAKQTVVRARPAEIARLRAPAPRAPRPAPPPPLAATSSSTHEHRTTRSQQRCRPATVMTALWLAPLDGVAVTVPGGVEGRWPAAAAAAVTAVVLLVFFDRDDRGDAPAAQAGAVGRRRAGLIAHGRTGPGTGPPGAWPGDADLAPQRDELRAVAVLAGGEDAGQRAAPPVRHQVDLGGPAAAGPAQSFPARPGSRVLVIR